MIYEILKQFLEFLSDVHSGGFQVAFGILQHSEIYILSENQFRKTFKFNEIK